MLAIRLKFISLLTPLGLAKSDARGSRNGGIKMKVVLSAILALAIGSFGQSGALAASARGEAARFAAMSLSSGQGARAIVSNVLAPANGSQFAPCQVQVSFFGADGSLIGKATAAQLKAGESISVPAQNPSKLVRAAVSIGDVVDPAKVCALRTSVEIFDVQTGTTLVSVPSSNSECSVSATTSAIGAARKPVSGPRNSASAIPSSR
jgi:hypothetical protein